MFTDMSLSVLFSLSIVDGGEYILQSAHQGVGCWIVENFFEQTMKMIMRSLGPWLQGCCLRMMVSHMLRPYTHCLQTGSSFD